MAQAHAFGQLGNKKMPTACRQQNRHGFIHAQTISIGLDHGSALRLTRRFLQNCIIGGQCGQIYVQAWPVCKIIRGQGRRHRP